MSADASLPLSVLTALDEYADTVAALAMRVGEYDPEMSTRQSMLQRDRDASEAKRAALLHSLREMAESGETLRKAGLRYATARLELDRWNREAPQEGECESVEVWQTTHRRWHREWTRRTEAVDVALAALATAALVTADAPHPIAHVCGKQGFGAPGDSCPACASEARPADFTQYADAAARTPQPETRA